MKLVVKQKEESSCHGNSEIVVFTRPIASNSLRVTRVAFEGEKVV